MGDVFSFLPTPAPGTVAVPAGGCSRGCACALFFLVVVEVEVVAAAVMLGSVAGGRSISLLR